MNDEEITLNKTERETLQKLLDMIKLPFGGWDKYDEVMSKIYGEDTNE
jgi:hypothetical protein